MKKMVFLNIGWMKSYQGITRSDRLIGGGSYPRIRGYGVEIFNFAPYGGNYYGACGRMVSIGRLGAPERSDSLKNVLAIWVAKEKTGGIFIVGWYNDATIYRIKRKAPIGTKRIFKGRTFRYFIKAQVKNSKLLAEDERIFQIPSGKGGKGQYHVWYADKPRHVRFKRRVFAYIKHGGEPAIQHKRNKSSMGRQVDPILRLKVEESAIRAVAKYYGDIGYQIDSVEDDNVGWDLEARMKKRLLRLEVKGLSNDGISVGVTPNEYLMMKHFRDTYRICIVSKALSHRPKLSIFSFSSDSGHWEDRERNRLKIKEIKSAHLFI